jgi:hypothetical protein
MLAGWSSPPMTPRLVACALWAYFGWYAAAYLLTMLDMPTTLAPFGGAVMIVVVVLDWRTLVRRSATVPARGGADTR